MEQRVKGPRRESTEQGGSDGEVFDFIKMEGGYRGDQESTQRVAVGRVEAARSASRKDVAESRQSGLMEALELREHTLGEAVEQQKVEELDVRQRDGVNMAGGERGSGDKESFWYPLARIISLALHPIMIPTYLLLVMLYGETALALFSKSAKFYLILLSTINTVVIPLLFILLMRTVLYNRIFTHKMRYIFTLLAVACCYLMSFLALSDPLFAIIRQMFVLWFVGAIFAFVVSYFWRISIYTMGALAGITFLLMLHISGIALVGGELMSAILLAGALASARLLLGRESVAQVAVGAAMGVVLAVIVMI